MTLYGESDIKVYVFNMKLQDTTIFNYENLQWHCYNDLSSGHDHSETINSVAAW